MVLLMVMDEESRGLDQAQSRWRRRRRRMTTTMQRHGCEGGESDFDADVDVVVWRQERL